MSPAPGLEMDASLGPCHWVRVPSPVPLSPLFGPRLAPTVGFLPTQFILKHEKYQHLREVERFPNSFNPHVPDTLALLKSLLSQVMEKHRRSSWIHIGADEVGSAGPQAPPAARPAPRRAEHPLKPQIQVFHLGEGMDSKSWMSHNRGDVGTMYLKHIKQVLGFIAARYQGLRALMWDDMLRKISTGALRGERMGTAAVGHLGGGVRTPRHPPAAGPGADVPVPALQSLG